MNNSSTNIHDLTPPKELMFVGGSLDNSNVIGEAFVSDFQFRCGLQPHERVLDVGCGVGRIAIPLTKFLNSEGRYEGFDIVAKRIEWCQENVTPRYPNFNFRVADIYNKQYHRSGKQKASSYRFPYADSSFDFVCLTSVFTHMLPRDMENYFREISRVLTIGGRCMITFFILNQESLDAIKAGKSTISFDHALKQCRVHSLETPEGAVAYPESHILSLYKANGLEVDPPLLHGVWSGRTSEYLGYQDIIIAHKTQPGLLQKDSQRAMVGMIKILLKESRDDLRTFLKTRELPRGLLTGSFNFGFCPICEAKTVFIIRKDWLRDFYHCARCGSIPRWRAVIHVLQTHFPSWRTLKIHESSPGGASSEKLQRESEDYVATHFFSDVTPGKVKDGFRCENLEHQTFPNAEFDLVITQDVFEHILNPASALSEIARTLKPGGAHVFTVPWYHWKETLIRVIEENGSIRHLEDPDYHGNPIDPNGSLVVREWGWDLCDFIYRHSGLTTTVIRLHDKSRGIAAEFIEVFISRKLPLNEINV